MTWDPPPGPWVLHSCALLGNLTDRWINTQAAAHRRLETRLLGLYAASGELRQSHWWVAADRPRTYLAYRGMHRSGGRSLLALVRDLRRNAPMAVHAHYGPAAVRHIAFARALDARLVASFYGYDATMVKYTASARWRRRYARLFAAADAVVVEGPAMGRRVARLGCSEDKLRIVRLPADAAGLESCSRIAAEGFAIVAAGHFIEKKGFDTAIRAFARGLGDRDDAKLLMVGAGPDEPQLRRLTEELRISERVVWTGYLPFGEFMNVIGSAHVGIYPSRRARDGDSEGGAPVTLIEAQWLGVPAIVSDHDDLPFVAAPGGSIVLRATDVGAWADALRSLYDAPAQLDPMGGAARAFARQHHAPETNASLREAIYAGEWR
jgi:colanic acid/amylovoran/stewartan biosynthesis glycosyltransferase WcaL/AmsK/CpsK